MKSLTSVLALLATTSAFASPLVVECRNFDGLTRARVQIELRPELIAGVSDAAAIVKRPFGLTFLDAFAPKTMSASLYDFVSGQNVEATKDLRFDVQPAQIDLEVETVIQEPGEPDFGGEYNRLIVPALFFRRGQGAHARVVLNGDSVISGEVSHVFDGDTDELERLLCRLLK